LITRYELSLGKLKRQEKQIKAATIFHQQRFKVNVYIYKHDAEIFIVSVLENIKLIIYILGF